MPEIQTDLKDASMNQRQRFKNQIASVRRAFDTVERCKDVDVIKVLIDVNVCLSYIAYLEKRLARYEERKNRKWKFWK